MKYSCINKPVIWLTNEVGLYMDAIFEWTSHLIFVTFILLPGR